MQNEVFDKGQYHPILSTGLDMDSLGSLYIADIYYEPFGWPD